MGSNPSPGRSEVECPQTATENAMEERIVECPERVRAGRKAGVVRYVLAVSLLLVVILFAVAYTVVV
jgi:hypothetical protein